MPDLKSADLEKALHLATTRNTELCAQVEKLSEPVPMRLHCPGLLFIQAPAENGSLVANIPVVCGALHVDEGEYATKPHHTHACQVCGHVWRPAVVNTVGVRFLPGYK